MKRMWNGRLPNYVKLEAKLRRKFETGIITLTRNEITSANYGCILEIEV